METNPESRSQEIKAVVITTICLGPKGSKRTSPNDSKVQRAALQRRKKNARKGELHGKVTLLAETQTKPTEEGGHIVAKNKIKGHKTKIQACGKELRASLGATKPERIGGAIIRRTQNKNTNLWKKN